MSIDARDHPADDLETMPEHGTANATEHSGPGHPDAAHMLDIESTSAATGPETPPERHRIEGVPANRRMELVEEPETADPTAEASAYPEPDPSDRVLTNQPRGPDTAIESNADPPEIVTATVPPENSMSSDRDETELRRTAAIDRVCTRYQVDSAEARAAVEKAYEVVYEYQAPFIVRHTIDMLEDFKADVAAQPDTVGSFLGRDGHPIALAAYALEPELFESNCTEVTVSRCLADSVVQDLERNGGKNFEAIEGFRSARADVDPDDVPGAKAQMTRYLESRGMSVGVPGTTIVLFDSSFKGTVQELFSASFPDVDFRGRYLIFGESPDDPHPGSKTGYALHQSVDRADTDQDSADLATIFTEKDAVLAIEHVLRGPLSKAVRFDRDDIPVQELESPPLDQINPLDVAPDYLDANVRLAVMEANQLAVGHYAESIAAQRRTGGDWHNELTTKSETFMRQVRSWVTRNSETDPAFAELCDSFVRRTDKNLVGNLRTAIEHRGLDETDATQVWRDYQQLGSLEDKEAFVVRHTYPSTGASHG
ncbi:hypothetical protein ACFYO1_13555 [Nocardia sp. NPDC006044]|uniref:hypothetical protein n=1 Tax=Nocardia sp. NPDC006044 TaxID=3364306 RepID=UPI0036823B5F